MSADGAVTDEAVSGEAAEEPRRVTDPEPLHITDPRMLRALAHPARIAILQHLALDGPDTATGCAVHSTLPAGYGYTSIDLTTKFLRPVTVASGQLRCVGTVVSRGRRTALAEARLTDAAGRLVAMATSSCLIFEIPA